MRGVLFNLLSQRGHKDSEGSEIAVKCIAPDGVRQVSVRQCFANVFAKQTEQFVLDRSQGQLLSAQIGRTGGKIDLEIAVFKNMGGKAPL